VLSGSTHEVIATLNLPAPRTYTDFVVSPAGFSGFAVDGVNGVLVLTTMAEDEDGDFWPGTVVLIDEKQRAPAKTIDFPTSPGAGRTYSVAADPALGLAYIPVVGVDDPATDSEVAPGNVLVLDVNTGQVITTVPVGTSPTAVAVDSTTHVVYVINDVDDTLSVIDGHTHKVTTTVAIDPSPNGTQEFPSLARGLAVDSSTHTIYVALVPGNRLAVIDGSTNRVTTTIPLPGDAQGIGVDPTTHAIYAMGNPVGQLTGIDEALWIIDGTTTGMLGTLPIGYVGPGWGAAIAVDTTTHTVYVPTGKNIAVFSGVQ
jgi:YVTN family beta-propeller protein